MSLRPLLSQTWTWFPPYLQTPYPTLHSPLPSGVPTSCDIGPHGQRSLFTQNPLSQDFTSRPPCPTGKGRRSVCRRGGLWGTLPGQTGTPTPPRTVTSSLVCPSHTTCPSLQSSPPTQEPFFQPSPRLPPLSPPSYPPVPDLPGRKQLSTTTVQKFSLERWSSIDLNLQ